MIYVIESPFAASAERTQEEHRIHALKLCRATALAHPGSLVFASHAYCPQFLFENRPEEREAGIQIQKYVMRRANYVLAWDDWGISRGMRAGIDYATLEVLPVKYHTRGEVPEWDHLDEIILPGELREGPACLATFTSTVPGDPERGIHVCRRGRGHGGKHLDGKIEW